MGREDYHPHEFRMERVRFGVPSPEDRLMGGLACVNEKKVHSTRCLENVPGQWRFAIRLTTGTKSCCNASAAASIQVTL
jgi:hypothetical protein